jgi:hypothetical protein
VESVPDKLRVYGASFGRAVPSEAGAGGSNTLTPTIYLRIPYLWLSNCLFCVHVDDKVFTKATSNIPIRTVPRYTHLRAEDLVGRLG